ncbi:MAG: tetratricopeptide repeat protein [Vitreoscilla sp.]|nr:tetratricopeptide repeat protein [Burkholderiales bacterium]MBP6336655.1 tetratricopeptide repeat protein [Vitreoscilla sp.]MBP6675272.1 tetratricopeptide repeat protein [Vitreoscilla sp.]
MATIQTPYSHLHALIIDDMSVQQTTLRGQLASLGIHKIDQATTADEALRLVKSRPYGLILCDYNLNSKTDGQQFFEHLRDNDLLPPDCLFFMITAEGGYASVAAATEHKPDAYLLKPITAADIGERLKLMLEKRQALLPITQRLRRHDLPGAVSECDAMLAKKDRWFMQVLQMKGQTQLQLGRHEEAKGVYRQALDVRGDLVWAQLGMARAHKAAGQFEQARQIATDIIQSRDGDKHVAAYDVVAESLEAQGDMAGALWVLRDAAAVVPSARRHRLVGESAYRNGDLDAAKDSFQMVTKATKGSVIAQAQDTLSLAQTLVDRGEAKDALGLLAEGNTLHKNNPAFDNVALAIKAQAQVQAGDPDGALQTVQKARETMRKAKADFATVALAKAELMTGHEVAGLALMEKAVASDHENPRVKQLIGKALSDTGHEDKIAKIIEAAAAGLESRVKDAKTLFRDSRIDEALSAIESAVHDYPENTGVLLQAAQMNCLSLRLKKELNPAVVERVRLYLTRLDKLMPASDRVTQMQRYFRETVGALTEAAKASA